MPFLDYFIKYVKVDTQASDESKTSPSTKKQLNLSKILKEDIECLGYKARIDKYGRVHAFIEGEGKDIIGFNAHIDTALEVSDENVNPRVIKNYDGNDIILSDKYITKITDYPFLKDFICKTLVVTDGETLLGADDKAGLAIIMALLEYISQNKEFKHSPISIMFTCDEEVGRGPENFDAKEFKADYAYTLDGSSPFIVNYENFNAKSALITFKGKSIHPGEAKGKLINASNLLMEFDSLLPKKHTPRDTEKYQGFHHMTFMEGNVEEAKSAYILRDHDYKKLEKMVFDFNKAKETLSKKYPNAIIDLKIIDSYRNMKEVFDRDRRALDKIEEVYKRLNLKFNYEPIRGGTDGAEFSFRGCPTPNLGTGSYNHHGRHEFLVVEEALLLVNIIKEIVKI